MQVFSRQMTNYVAEQFYLYFKRQNGKTPLTPREARDIINYVSPSLPPTSVGSMDYSSPRVDGGGIKRPSDERIARIIERIEDEDDWDDVFRETLDRCAAEQKAEKVALLTFKDRKDAGRICAELKIGRQTYYDYRSSIVCIASVIAISKNILNYY